jgi:hypothetical protein
MDRERVLEKLEQIEEQAHFTLNEFPKHLTKERLRLIIALARFTIFELSTRADTADATTGEGNVGLARAEA